MDLLARASVASKTIRHTPGSVTEACTNDEMQMKNRYAKKTGTAGDTWCERYGPLDSALVTDS